MFIRPCYRRIKGKRQAYWAPVESYRTERGPRQRTVAGLGKLKKSERAGVKRAAQGKSKSRYSQLQLFNHEDKQQSDQEGMTCAKFRLTGSGIHPAFFWVSDDGVLRQVLIDGRKLMRLQDDQDIGE